jgi:SAM-dependent methyltransferase
MTTARLHRSWVAPRRAQYLAALVAPLLGRGARVLDFGAGDGRIASLISAMRPDVTIEGIDVLPRSASEVPVHPFDGERAPFDDASYDTVLLLDVLHHTGSPSAVLREAARLARRSVVVKDHICESRLDRATLSFMDRVGNARFGVALPGSYLSRDAWGGLFAAVGTVTHRDRCAGLYPWPLSLVFGRGLHFLAVITREAADGE